LFVLQIQLRPAQERQGQVIETLGARVGQGDRAVGVRPGAGEIPAGLGEKRRLGGQGRSTA
jgi:hypothetical protein